MAGRYSQDQPLEFHFGQWSTSTESESYDDDAGPVEPICPDDIALYDCELPPKFTVKPLFEAIEEQENSGNSGDVSNRSDYFDFGASGSVVLGLDDTIDFRRSVIRNSLDVSEMAQLTEGLGELEEEEPSGELVVSRCEEVLDSENEESQTEMVVTECEEVVDSGSGEEKALPSRSEMATTDRMLLLTDSDDDVVLGDAGGETTTRSFEVPRLKLDESTTVHRTEKVKQDVLLSESSTESVKRESDEKVKSEMLSEGASESFEDVPVEGPKQLSGSGKSRQSVRRLPASSAESFDGGRRSSGKSVNESQRSSVSGSRSSVKGRQSEERFLESASESFESVPRAAQKSVNASQRSYVSESKSSVKGRQSEEIFSENASESFESSPRSSRKNVNDSQRSSVRGARSPVKGRQSEERFSDSASESFETVPKSAWKKASDSGESSVCGNESTSLMIPESEEGLSDGLSELFASSSDIRKKARKVISDVDCSSSPSLSEKSGGKLLTKTGTKSSSHISFVTGDSQESDVIRHANSSIRASKKRSDAPVSRGTDSKSLVSTSDNADDEMQSSHVSIVDSGDDLIRSSTSEARSFLRQSFGSKGDNSSNDVRGSQSSLCGDGDSSARSSLRKSKGRPLLPSGPRSSGTEVIAGPMSDTQQERIKILNAIAKYMTPPDDVSIQASATKDALEKGNADTQESSSLKKSIGKGSDVRLSQSGSKSIKESSDASGKEAMSDTQQARVKALDAIGKFMVPPEDASAEEEEEEPVVEIEKEKVVEVCDPATLDDDEEDDDEPQRERPKVVRFEEPAQVDELEVTPRPVSRPELKRAHSGSTGVHLIPKPFRRHTNMDIGDGVYNSHASRYFREHCKRSKSYDTPKNAKEEFIGDETLERILAKYAPPRDDETDQTLSDTASKDQKPNIDETSKKLQTTNGTPRYPDIKTLSNTQIEAYREYAIEQKRASGVDEVPEVQPQAMNDSLPHYPDVESLSEGDFILMEEEVLSPAQKKPVMQCYELIPETSIRPEARPGQGDWLGTEQVESPIREFQFGKRAETSSSTSEDDDKDWKDDEPAVNPKVAAKAPSPRRQTQQSRDAKADDLERTKHFDIKTVKPVKYVGPDDTLTVTLAKTRRCHIPSISDTPASLFEYICEPPEVGPAEVVSLVMTITAVHNIPVPKDLSSLYLTFEFANERCVGREVHLVRDGKKGKYAPKEDKHFLVHMRIRPEVLIKMDLIGDERVLASTNLLMINKALVKPGKHLLMFSQRPEKDCFVKHRRTDPCLEIHIATVSIADETKLKPLPRFIILPVYATDCVVAFRELLQDQRTSHVRISRQLLAMFNFILNDSALMKKLEKSFTDAMKKVPKDHRIQEKLRTFYQSLTKIVFAVPPLKQAPFHTDEITAIVASGLVLRSIC